MAAAAVAAVATSMLLACMPAYSDTLTLDFERGTTLEPIEGRQSVRLLGPGKAGEPAVAAARLAPPMLYFEAGDASQRQARLVPDPDTPSNQVLEFALMSANVALRSENADREVRKGRVQMDVYGNDGVAEVYQAVRVRLADGFRQLAEADEPFAWLTLSEWWNDAGWTGETYPFRISLDLGNRGAQGQRGLFLQARATLKPAGAREWSTQVWAQRADGWSLPVDQWFLMETWFREGGTDQGRFVVAVTPAAGARRVLIDVTGPTHHPAQTAPDGLRHFNPIKLYTSGRTVALARRTATKLAVLWDDLSIQACSRALGNQPSPCEHAMWRR